MGCCPFSTSWKPPNHSAFPVSLGFCVWSVTECWCPAPVLAFQLGAKHQIKGQILLPGGCGRDDFACKAQVLKASEPGLACRMLWDETREEKGLLVGSVEFTLFGLSTGANIVVLIYCFCLYTKWLKPGDSCFLFAKSKIQLNTDKCYLWKLEEKHAPTVWHNHWQIKISETLQRNRPGAENPSLCICL